MKRWSAMNTFSRICASLVGLLLFSTIIPGNLSGQDQTDESTENVSAPRYTEPVSIIWEFGIQATAGADSRSILATAPLPVEWPEQTVEIIDEIKTDNVNRISFKDLTREAQQMVVRINNLPAGETARAVVRVRISRSNTLTPIAPETLTIPARPSSRLRKYLRPSPMIESNHSRIEEIAEAIGTDPSLNDWQIVEAVYDWVRENIEYRFANENYTCLQALDMGYGDCGELSSLFVAICRAKGIPARCVWIPGHAYPEFYLEDPEGNGHWIPCQAAGQREFGAMTESSPILQKGDNFKVPGISDNLAYIRPTLVAKEAPGGIDFVHITDQIEVESRTEDENRTRPSLMNREEEHNRTRNGG
ncbi:MAG: transglutaminase domain-containing protein [Planctomycetota bacterium]